MMFLLDLRLMPSPGGRGRPAFLDITAVDSAGTGQERQFFSGVSIAGSSVRRPSDEPKESGSQNFHRNGGATMYTVSYQVYRAEHGLRVRAAEQRAADARAGEIAAALSDLRLRLGRALRLGHRGRPASGLADAVTAPVRFLSSVR
jgi:hypothetical protein